MTQPTQQFFVPSSRLVAMQDSRKSIGASCNVFQVDDSITSIAESQSWAYQVLAYQGAPSLDFSKVRPVNSVIRSGGTSSGAVSFMQPFDTLVGVMRRTEKKNGAGLVALDWSHPDLRSFIESPLQYAYKAVYLPEQDSLEMKRFLSKEFLETRKYLANAYDGFDTFLVKRPAKVNGEPMLVNLCTEVEIPHKGTCILATVNLANYDTLGGFCRWFPLNFLQSATEMLEYWLPASKITTEGTPLQCDSSLNHQFGLGVMGLASALAIYGITYKELAEEMKVIIADDYCSISTLAHYWDTIRPKSKAQAFVTAILQGYAKATQELERIDPTLRAAFCIQPTVSSAQRTLDSRSFFVSPEIQPVIGLRHANGVSTIVKSAVKGDHRIDYHPRTETIYEVDYEDYRIVSEGWQVIMDSTSLSHRHSHCFYGQEFTLDHLNTFCTSHIRSLYYRLPWNTNVESMAKSELWQDVSEGELVDFDVDELLSTCSITEASCDCQN